MDAFCHCTGLTSVEIPSSVKVIDSYAFAGCTGLTSVEIPSSVKEIGFNAFYSCTGLTSVEIPSSVAVIDGYAFADCDNLKCIYSFIDKPAYVKLGENVFDYNATLYVKKGLKEVYQLADGWNKFKDIKEMTDEMNKEELPM